MSVCLVFIVIFFGINEKWRKNYLPTHLKEWNYWNIMKYTENPELFKLFVCKQVAKIWIAKECVYIMST